MESPGIENEEESGVPAMPSVVTNQHVLLVTTVLFGAFVVAEVIGSFAGNSLSLLGDAAAMSIDVFTYLTNMYAERIKASDNIINESTRMMLEVYIPSFSICSLLAVTGWIMYDAINVIQGKDREQEVNVSYLFGFSSANFVVDIVSSCMFAYRGNAAFSTVDEQSYSAVPESEAGDGDTEQPANKLIEWNSSREGVVGGLRSRLNLNMCSALTHLGGDTLRTSSVFIAAVVAATSRAPVNLCDAWAAVVVSVTTVALVLPLVYHIYIAASVSDQ